jgi:hypothetical protein
MFITAYRVDGTCNSKGPFMAYSQQLYLLEEKDSVEKDPITNFYKDLKEVILHLQQDNHEKIIMIDANACLKEQNKFSQWVSELQQIHPMTAQHGTERQPATFQGANIASTTSLLPQKYTSTSRKQVYFHSNHTMKVTTALYI